ncbi:MAG: hypothetical protein ABT940_03800 [Alphaproteobacteria bacterium]
MGGSRSGGINFPRFVKSVYQALDLERQGKSSDAISLWNTAGDSFPGYALPFTRATHILLRQLLGNPPPPRQPTPGRRRITMTSLGNNGRYGNQLLQYGFLKVYTTVHGMELEVPDWPGRWIFDHDDPYPQAALSRMWETQADFFGSLSDPGSGPGDIDLYGGFRDKTPLLEPFRDLWRSCFVLGERAEAWLSGFLAPVTRPGSTLVAIHLRRGDLVNHLLTTPVDLYLDWLRELWPTLEAPMLYVATEDLSMLHWFAAYQPVYAGMIAPGVAPEMEFLIDFEVLRRARILAISAGHAGSTFSVTAAMLNQCGGTFYWPHPKERRLLPFDPWRTELLVGQMDPLPPIPRSDHPDRPTSEAERLIIDRYIGGGTPTVLSSGGRGGGWMKAVLERRPDCRMHVFGTGNAEFEKLCQYAGQHIHNVTLARSPIREANVFPDWPDTLDEYCRASGIRHVDFLNIAEESDAEGLLSGALDLLFHARIDLIQLPGDMTSALRAERVFTFLVYHGFMVYSVQEGAMFPMYQWKPGASENWRCLAIHQRLLGLLTRRPPLFVDVPGILEAQRICVAGMVHVGPGWEGALARGREMGARALLLIEGEPGFSGAVMGGSLPEMVAVPRFLSTLRGIDDVMEEHGLSPWDFTLLVLDLPGEAMRVLKGASGLLEYLRAIQITVSFQDLGPECGTIDAVDDFLACRGFFRVDLRSPVERYLGDALYVRAADYVARRR